MTINVSHQKKVGRQSVNVSVLLWHLAKTDTLTSKRARAGAAYSPEIGERCGSALLSYEAKQLKFHTYEVDKCLRIVISRAQSGRSCTRPSIALARANPSKACWPEN